ncbi:OmpA family protein [Sutterella wadsworthensis]|uniref:OmpA family protein n=1 Tax=Sutterella wadsworthensis TaxID=40545 RepID=UPI00242FA4C6|nr:OmpA family protein [Sutterella wadsworthensis]
MALGQRRADAVKGFLAGKGVDAGKVSTVSYGEEKPAVLGHDEAAYSKNRRAVLAY